jgi:hypothetical protein
MSLASVLQDNHKPQLAFKVYEEALTRMQERSESLSKSENLLMGRIGCILGKMAEQMDGNEETAERFLLCAIKAFDRAKLGPMGLLHDDGANIKMENASADVDLNTTKMITALRLPKEATDVHTIAPFILLQSLYTRTGRPEYVLCILALQNAAHSKPLQTCCDNVPTSYLYGDPSTAPVHL